MRSPSSARPRTKYVSCPRSSLPVDSQSLFAELASLSPAAREEFIYILQDARAHCVERMGASLTHEDEVRVKDRRVFYETLARQLRGARSRFE